MSPERVLSRGMQNVPLASDIRLGVSEMACKNIKQMILTVFEQKHIRKEWHFDFDDALFKRFYGALSREMKKFGIVLSLVRNRESIITVNSYADLLNAARVSSPDDGHMNLCVGHIIGKSENLDILEDIRTAVRRVAFAPETIPPSSEFRKVCHNCGCGC
jgi:sugar phosphate isomerase/epimerase